MRKYLSILFIWLATSNVASAQNAAAIEHIKSASNSGYRLFMASGAPALQKEIEYCYDGADKKPNEREFLLETTRCIANDHLGLILFISHKRTMEKYGQKFDDPFFNPDAQSSRIARFLANRGLDQASTKKLSDQIFTVVFSEFMGSSKQNSQQPVNPQSQK